MVAALWPVVGGCGNAKRDFRVDRLNPLVEQATKQRVGLADTLRSSRPRRLGDVHMLRAALARFAATTRRLAALRPPHGTETAFRRLTTAYRTLVDALGRFLDAFATGGEAQQRDAAAQSASAISMVDRAQAVLQHALR
jgi:hypothetical protein